MRRKKLGSLFLFGLGLIASIACSGQTTTSPSSNDGGAGGSGGTGGTGGQGGTGGSACPSDLAVRTGLACQSVAIGCTSDACVFANGSWLCAAPCPCSVGESCAVLEDRDGCVPGDIAHCFQPSGGSGGSGGVGGSGGTGGTGVGGFGGAGGTGGTNAGGSGGTGPCNGEPACYGGEASFCSTDGTRLLSCEAGDDCPAVTDCKAFCPGCLCHMAPPVNGVLRGTCDTCTTSAECTGNMQCLEHPMFPGSGAKTCVAP